MEVKNEMNVAVNNEDLAEDWCFICKDGGDLRMCDYPKCPKSYHHHCLGMPVSFLESETQWNCARHFCAICKKSSNLRCFTCTYALCGECYQGLTTDAFLRVQRKKGFCSDCLKLVLLIEGNKGYDSDGENVDFTDIETEEGLFKEYYLIIKDQYGFTLVHIYDAQDRVKKKKDRAAQDQVKTKKVRSRSSSEELNEDEEEQISENNGMENEKKRRKICKEKRYGRKKFTMKKSNKMEFIGWSSKSLIEFLSSIGKCTVEKLSHHDVTSIVNEYIKEKKLLHPKDWRKVICDEPLKLLFKKEKINSYSVSDLLEAHLADDEDESAEDEPKYKSEKKHEPVLATSESEEKLGIEKSPKIELQNDVNYVSCNGFAAIVDKNVELVYLKKSVLYQLLNEPDSFKEKVLGCFVRVKSDNGSGKYQLMQVKGIKLASASENSTETILLFSTMPNECPISLVSDVDFLKAEIEDLRKQVQSGLLERPTVVELEQKAKIVHKDIMKHWIDKRLNLLQKRIDQANEKGWRPLKYEFLDEKKKLQSPTERSRLLNTIREVIPVIFEPDFDSEDIKNDVKCEEGYPKSTPSVLSDVWDEKRPPVDIVMSRKMTLTRVSGERVPSSDQAAPVSHAAVIAQVSVEPAPPFGQATSVRRAAAAPSPAVTPDLDADMAVETQPSEATTTRLRKRSRVGEGSEQNESPTVENQLSPPQGEEEAEARSQLEQLLNADSWREIEGLLSNMDNRLIQRLDREDNLCTGLEHLRAAIGYFNSVFEEVKRAHNEHEMLEKRIADLIKENVELKMKLQVEIKKREEAELKLMNASLSKKENDDDVNVEETDAAEGDD